MSVKLNLKPFSASISQTKSVAFSLAGFDVNKKYRVAFENATFDRNIKVVSLDGGLTLNDKFYVNNLESVNGKIDLSLYETDSVGVVSIYANIEEFTEAESWRLSDISAFAFQIENAKTKTTGDKISIYPPFVNIQQKTTINVQTDPNSDIHVLVNNKRFVIKSNFAGEGSFSFRGIDVLSGTPESISSLQKFPIMYSKSSDNYTEVYDSGSFVHFVPENMKALQATNASAEPECAILDPSPGQGLTIQKLDDFCIDGPVVGEYSIFNEDNDSYYNSKVGFCSSPTQIYPLESNEAVCRIYNSTSSAVLSNGAGLVVFSSQETSSSDDVVPSLASRVFVAHIPSSLKYKGNPVRDGTIVRPPNFYHTVTPSNISDNEKYGITFRIDDGSVFEIQYTTIQGTEQELIASFVELINVNLEAIANDIKAVNQGTYIEIQSDTRFTIRSDVLIGNGTLDVKLKANKTLDLLTNDLAIKDEGNTVIFLFPKVGYQSHRIVSRDVDKNIIRIEVLSGFNNDIGPNINDNIYCQKFVVVDSGTEMPSTDLVEVNPLPYIFDMYNREVPSVYPVIATRKIESTGKDIAYVICQSPVNGSYQLFFYSFRVGEDVENVKWKQLTSIGENKNAKIKCDSIGNLHLVWESDRLGPVQVYYSIMGPSSKSISNSVMMSVLDKNIDQNTKIGLLSISNSSSILQDNWTRILGGDGRASVYNKTYVGVIGDPSKDTAMVYYTLDKDEFGKDFPWYFNQLSYQISFDLWMPKPSTGVLNDKGIESKFSEWKEEFTPFGDYKYEKGGNLYTIDSYDPFFESMIPVCGAYKLDSSNLVTKEGGNAVDDIPNKFSPLYAEFSDKVQLSSSSNLKHFMLVVMPEKIRFKAKNTESYIQYCERRTTEGKDCLGFNNEINYELNTGRYKLALVIATCENESTGKLSSKNYVVHRMLPGYVDFNQNTSIKIAVHYSKMGSDYLDLVSKRERGKEDEYRYAGDIIVSVGNETSFATSFLADFSDQYTKFDIAFGFPPGDSFDIKNSVPYKGNIYEKETIKQVFYNIAISPHSIFPNSKIVSFSSFDRDTSQMVIPDITKNILSNSSFEDTVLPYSDSTVLLDGYQGVTGWTVEYGAVYRRTNVTDIVSWIELSGYKTSTVLYDKGAISSVINTEIGKKYIVLFNLANHEDTYIQGSNVTKKVTVTAGDASQTYSIVSKTTSSTPLVWKKRVFEFTATSGQSVIKFANSSNQFSSIKDIEYGPQIDSILIILESDLNNELGSLTTAESLLIDQDEFDLNYGLNVFDNITEIPLTFSSQFQNKNPDLFVDKIDKTHVVWQSNKNGFWDIYYSGSRIRGIPFRFDTRITDIPSNSYNPAISVDGTGRRLITWQDNRTGNNQIYAAVSNVNDENLVDLCKQDEVDEFLYRYNSAIDPYLDPYISVASQLNCAIEFSFEASDAQLYHFNLLFYEDKEYSKPYKTISSKKNISGWKCNNDQMSYNGLLTESNEVYNITYIPSYEDDLSGKVLYVIAEFEINANPINIANSTNVKMLQPYSGLNLGISRIEDENNITAILEFEDQSLINILSQTKDSLNESPFSGMSFESPLSELPGVSVGDKVKSVLLHFDPKGVDGSVSSKIEFTSPIAAIFISSSKLNASDLYFGYPGIKYFTSPSRELEAFDKVRISKDRKTLNITSYVNPSYDQIRVILADSSAVIGKNEFVYYCPSVQAPRCDVKCQYTNNNSSDKQVHFRVTFYADIEKTSIILSTFSKHDTYNWFASSSVFPSDGLLARNGETVNVVYSPEVVPFDLYESQKQENLDNNIVRQPLLCGVSYHVVVESYVDEAFFVESEFDFICPCNRIDSGLWNKDTDSSNWVCSGQGFEDFRVSMTNNQCLFPKILVTDFNVFYIIWQDFRYSRIQDNQISLSPDYFMAMYDANGVFVCSGQNNYDRRLTTFSDNGLVLYDASLFIDPFQNINLVMHDGSKLYSQSCSLGCKLLSLNKDLVMPCMFTDETDSSFFVVGGSDRTVSQYQKIRLSSKYVAFSTYLDLEKPISVVNDCFVEFDIVGVPGTYAYRLRNENDEEWSEWLPIGPDLPVQSKTDTDATKSERDFFRAYFTQRDVFVAPWIVSPGNGVKRVCCEILTFFGKTETFCVDFMAIYDTLEYNIDLFFDNEFSKPVPKYKNYMVVSEYQTDTIIDDVNLTSIKEDVVKVSRIYARIEFKDKKKMKIIERLQPLSKFSYLDKISMSVYQQGINDQIGIALTKISDGVYSGFFDIEPDDGVVNVDGLAIIVVDIPGQCKPITFSDLSQRSEKLDTNILEQDVSIFNDFTIFRERYVSDKTKGSFGDPDYYKFRKFGFSSDKADIDWTGAGPGPLDSGSNG